MSYSQPAFGIALVGALLLAASFAVESRALTATDGDTQANVSLLGPCAVLPGNFCTFDLNVCGGSSACGCPEGYTFNPSVGLCLIDDVRRATGPGDVEVPRTGYEGNCVQPTSGACDRRVKNVCGFQSVCMCDEEGKYDWSPQLGKCVLTL